jgi:hypothetical protein
MRILKPNPGECADRQGILELKIKAAGGVRGEIEEDVDTKEDATDEVVYGTNRWILKDPSPINIQPFLDESELIQRYLEKEWFCDIPQDRGEAYDKLYEELAEVNTQIWQLIDQGRTLRDAPDRMQATALQRAAEVLFAQADLNDKRADLVSRINKLFNLSVVEKIHA